MKVTYLGTGAAEGVPALFCQCEYCKLVRARKGKEVRSRAQLLLGSDVSVDFPPDAFYHATRFDVDMSAIKYLVVTHSHIDHFYAQDFILRGYKYASEMSSPELHIFGNQEVIEVFEESTRRELREDVKLNIHLHEVKAFEPFSFGEWTGVPLKAQHTSRDPFVYLLKKKGFTYLHLSDTGPLPEETFSYLENSGEKFDLITFDCTFLDEMHTGARRHMSIFDNMEIVERLKKSGIVDENTRKVITHFSHNASPSVERIKTIEREFGVVGAYDGMTIEI